MIRLFWCIVFCSYGLLDSFFLYIKASHNNFVVLSNSDYNYLTVVFLKQTNCSDKQSRFWPNSCTNLLPSSQKCILTRSEVSGMFKTITTKSQMLSYQPWFMRAAVSESESGAVINVAENKQHGGFNLIWFVFSCKVTLVLISDVSNLVAHLLMSNKMPPPPKTETVKWFEELLWSEFTWVKVWFFYSLWKPSRLDVSILCLYCAPIQKIKSRPRNAARPWHKSEPVWIGFFSYLLLYIRSKKAVHFKHG